VTNQRVGRADLVNLQRHALEKYQREVEAHDQEFLRVYLENPSNAWLVENYFASYLAQMRRLGLETSLFINVPLAESQKRRALVLLDACVRSQESQEIREAAATEILLGCIYGDNGQVPRSRKMILEELQATFGDGMCISEDLVAQTLNNLVIQHRVEMADDTYRLSTEEAKRLDVKIEQAYSDDSRFYNSLLEEIKSRVSLTSSQEQDIRRAIAKGIGGVFEQMGIQIANAISERNPNFTLNEYPEINIIARKSVSSLSSEIQEPVLEVMRRLFMMPSDSESEYLYGVSESYLVYASFHLDPDARALDLESIRKNTLLIDTDILLQVMIGLEGLQGLYRKMLKSTQNLGVAMCTLPEMISEFIYKIQRSSDDYNYMNRPARLAGEVLNDLGDVFKAYYTRVAHTGQTWDQYISGLIGASKDKDERASFVANRLETEYGVLVRDFSSEFALDRNEIELFAREINDERVKHQSYKHDDLYTRDAKVALTVRELRLKNHGSRYWLISNDSILARVWQRRTQNMQQVYIFPPQSWFQYLAQNPASRSKPTDFALLMKSLTVSPARPKVPRNLLLTLIRLGVNISNFTTEALIDLNNRLYDQWVWREVLSKRPEEIADDQAVELRQALDSILQRIEETVAPDRLELTQKIVQREATIEELALRNRRLEEENQRLKEKEKNRATYQRRYVRRNK
jgi:hypothetical protein